MRYFSLLSLAASGTLLVTQTLADEDVNYDRTTNYRPENVTGLDYYYYPWKGSYYNGTTTFKIKDVRYIPRLNYDDEPLCPQLENITYSFSWPSILGILQTEGEDAQPDNKNPINLILSTSYSNFTKYFNDYMDSGNMQIRDQPWVFESMDVSRRLYGYEDTKPNFNLTVADGSGNDSPFRITGTSKLEDSSMQPIQMNMSSCVEKEAWWGVNFVSKDDDYDDDEDYEKMGLIDPSLQLVFDRESANLVIDSYVFANTLDRSDERTLPIVARMSVEFLGKGDVARSDVLNLGSEPSWTPTMGFGNNSYSLDYMVHESGGNGVAGREMKMRMKVMASVMGMVLLVVFW